MEYSLLPRVLPFATQILIEHLLCAGLSARSVAAKRRRSPALED